MSNNSFTQDLINNLRNGERCLNGNKIYKLYKDCPEPELKNFLRGYARSLNGPENLEGYSDYDRNYYSYYNPGIEPTIEYLADTSEPYGGGNYSSMSQRFHPSQSIQHIMGVRKREARLHQIWMKLHIANLVEKWCKPMNSMDLFNVVIVLSKLFEAPLNDATIKSKKNGSCKPAKWENSFILNVDNNNLNERQKIVYKAFINRADRKNAMRLYCELVGSCLPSSSSGHSLLDTGIKYEAAIYDKYGILLDVLKDPKFKNALYTMIFTAMMTTELGKRNSFTLDPQKHGALNPWLKYYLDNYGDKIERYDVIFSITPCEKYYNLMTEEQKMSQLKIWSKAVYPIAWYLDRQFNMGVTTCVEKGMLVPRHGTTTVDSGGYNSVTGAWNNSLRHLRWLQPGIYDVCYKCMKLLAGDQMCWASCEKSTGGGNATHLDENDRQMNVLKELTALGYRPWSTLFEPNRADEIRDAIVKACENNDIPPVKWLGKSKMRCNAKTQAQGDQVCGVSVGQGSTGLFSGMGYFGATPSTMT